MNINRCLFLSVFFTLVMGNANAQVPDRATNPEKGYVITNDNDTIYGTIDYLSGEKNATVCRFRRDGEPTFHQYSPDDLQGFAFMDGSVYYVSRTFPLNGGEVRIFAEYLLKGGVSLYRYLTNGETIFFLTDSDGKTAAIKEMDYSSYKAEEGRLLKRGNLQAAFTLLSASTETTESLWSRDITADNLVDITRHYNEQFCTEAGDCTVFRYNAKKSALYRLRMRLEAGHNFCHINNGAFSYSTNMPHLGVGVEATSKRMNPMLSLQFTLLAGIYNDLHLFTDSDDGKKRLWFELDSGALYRVATVGKTYPFIRGGVSISVAMGAFAGVGWEFPLGSRRLQLSATYKYNGLICSGSLVTGTIDMALVL